MQAARPIIVLNYYHPKYARIQRKRYPHIEAYRMSDGIDTATAITALQHIITDNMKWEIVASDNVRHHT